jgi:hypothetical protein
MAGPGSAELPWKLQGREPCHPTPVWGSNRPYPKKIAVRYASTHTGRTAAAENLKVCNQVDNGFGYKRAKFYANLIAATVTLSARKRACVGVSGRRTLQPQRLHAAERSGQSINDGNTKLCGYV